MAERPWGMLFGCEGAMLYFIARDRYSGNGAIIDAGAFIGASSYCLAKGLDHNRRIEFQLGRIHAFDQFRVWTEIGDQHEQMTKSLIKNFKLELDVNGSFQHQYERNLGPLLRHIEIHNGNILTEKWDRGPIEILFIDICKRPAIMSRMVDVFYRNLVPDLSLVIHQDYHHPLLPYIHVSQERLAEYFDIVDEKADASILLLLRKSIPGWVLDEVAAYPYTVDEELALMDRAIARLAMPDYVKLAKAVLLHRRGRTAAARSLLEAFTPIEESGPNYDDLQRNLQACRRELSR